MTERITARQRFPGRNEIPTSDSIHGDIRLWGNEGASRYRQSMKAKLGGKFEIYDGGGSRSQDSSDFLDSDQDLEETGHGAKCDSDSDSDHQRWTKNPLMIRRIKRSNKSQTEEKHWSGIAVVDVVTGNNNNNNIYSYNEGRVNERLNLGRTTNSTVCGSGSKGSSKYQRLEEMRRKRLNLSITSDEENAAPTTKTSTRYGSHIRSFPTPSSKLESDRQVEGCNSHFGAENVHKASLQADLASQSQSATLPTRNVQVAHKVNNFSTRGYQPTVFPPARTGFSSQLVNSDLSEKITPYNSTNQQPSTFHHKPQRIESHEHFYQEAGVATSRQNDSTGSQQPFYKMVNTKSPPTTRAFNTSPQVTFHQFSAQLPVHSFNSTVDQPLKSNGLLNLHYTKPSESPPRVQVFQTATLFGSSQQPNSGLITTHRAEKEKLSKSANKNLETGVSSLHRCGHSDDSLDELVESNIRYLDSTADRATAKRSTHYVKVLSQSDPTNVCPSGCSTGQYNQPSVQVRTSTSIQLHVSVPMDTYPNSLGTSAPHLLIEPTIDRREFDNQGISPPDVVPRKIARDISWTSPRTNSQYHDRDSLTQSDNPDQSVDTNHLKNYLYPEAAFTRGRASVDGKTRSDTEVSRPAKQMERGMFSDVEYDIEVSERVKKWETLLKVRNTKTSKHCDTIVENLEGETPALTIRSDQHKSAPSCQQLQLGSPYLKDVAHASSFNSRELSSEKSIFNYEKGTATDVPSVETQPRRFFQAAPDPPLNAQSQSARKMLHPPVSSARDKKSIINSDQSRQQMFAHRTHSIPVANASGETTNNASLPKNYDHRDWSSRLTRLSHDKHQEQAETKASLSTRPSKLTDVTKRRSAYRDELEEISEMKADTVINLRRQFDTGSTTVTSDDDQRSVSTASAKLARPPKEHSTQNESVDWSKVLPGYKTMIKDTDLWSPNLESTQGVPVSIERVTARTLQTIPFSEDPFWKEMEEMTSFDPASSVGHLQAGIVQDRSTTVDPVRSHSRVELMALQSLTLPNQPWNPVIPVTDRIHKSKSLYTPNITSLSVGTNRKTKSDAAIALDAVLEDINRSSMDRKQQNQGEKPMNAENTSRVSALTRISRDLQNHSNTTQSKLTFEDGHDALSKLGTDANLSSIKSRSAVLDHVKGEAGSSQQIQQNQYQPSQQLKKKDSDKPQLSQGILSGYHLDPHLLKQKLLKTGLVVETDMDETSEQYRKSWPRSSTPGNSITSSTTTPSYTKVTAQSNNKYLPKQSILSTLAQSPNLPGTAVVDSIRSNYGKKAGLSTLDNLQNALSPFRTTAYQPGPESLYGLSKLESFKESNPSTSEEAHTSVPGRVYNDQSSESTEPTSNKESSLPSSLSRLQEVNQSMDDLKNLALDVEQRISVIKNRLQSANENSLDSILSSLRALAPEVKRQENEPESFEDIYTTKKSKLSDALTELDRIYKSLELNERNVTSVPDKDNQKVYDRHTSNYPIISTQPRSIHLRPMQTRISSVFIRGMDSANKNNSDKEKEPPSDVLSKSFQAIVDEVNKTTELLSKVAERNRQENMAPETHKQSFKTTVKPGNTKLACSLAYPITDAVVTASTSSISARPTQAVNSLDSKFRPKLDGKVKDDNTQIKTVSEYISDKEFDTDGMQRKVLQPVSSTSQMPLKTKSNTVKVTASASTKQTASSSSPYVAQQLSQSTPVQNKPTIEEEEEEAVKRQSSDKTLPISPPTQPSPTLSRKVTTSSVSDVKLQSPQILSEKRTEETSGIQLLTEADKGSQPAASASTTKECSVCDNNESLHSLSVSSTATTNFVNSTNITTSTSLSTTAIQTSSVAENNKFRIESTDPELTENNLSVDPKTKRLIEGGVAMELDKFSSGQEEIVKPISHPQSAPDVTGVTDNQDTKQVQTQTTGFKENIKSSEPLVRSCEQSSSNNVVLSPCGKCAVSFLVKKVGDPEIKVATSEACSLHHSSPLNKPIVSPGEKQTLDQGKQCSDDDIQDDSLKTLDKELQEWSSGESTPSNGYQTPKEGGFPQEVKFQDTNGQQQPPNNRPHSFHELITSPETIEPETQDTDKFRKSASAGETNCDTL